MEKILSDLTPAVATATATLVSVIFGGGFLSYFIKCAIKKSDEAHDNTLKLTERVNALEKSVKDVHKIRLDVERIKEKVDNAGRDTSEIKAGVANIHATLIDLQIKMGKNDNSD